MAIVVLKPPNVKRKREERPKTCPYCEGEIVQRWGQVQNRVKDLRVRTVEVYRYRCCQCKRTFRHYPEENSRGDRLIEVSEVLNAAFCASCGEQSAT